jgi:soluble calcium-activated nucleotidase 1
LSELVKFQDNLYTFDDRSGIMFQVMNPARSDAAEAPFLVPRNIFMEGSGDVNDKGLKIEWATVKDSTLVVGSFGKEYTNNKGEIVHSNNLWSVVVKPDGTKAHVNWKPYYDAMRATLGYTTPGYFIHEAVVWSPHHRKWFVFPRRASKEAYDDVADEKRGSNMIIMASHDFKEVVSTTVGVSFVGGSVFFCCPALLMCCCFAPLGWWVHSPPPYTRTQIRSHTHTLPPSTPPHPPQTITPERGFSSAKFLPGSHDSVVIALKSEENAAAGTQKTFFTIFGEVPGSGGSKWKVLLEEQPLPIEKKFEGLEVLSTTP